MGGLRSVPTVSSPQQHLMTPALQLRWDTPCTELSEGRRVWENYLILRDKIAGNLWLQLAYFGPLAHFQYEKPISSTHDMCSDAAVQHTRKIHELFCICLNKICNCYGTEHRCWITWAWWMWCYYHEVSTRHTGGGYSERGPKPLRHAGKTLGNTIY